jgi:hypothetical protein
MGFVHRLRSRLTYANVMSSVAVFVALSGGAYALSVPKNSIGPRELRHGAVTTSKVRNHTLKASDLRRGVLPVFDGARAADVNPPPGPTTIVRSTAFTLKAAGKAFVLGTLRDVFLTCGDTPCSGQWGVYVDNQPVPSTGVVLQADVGGSDGYGFYTLYGITNPLSRGPHTVTLGLASAGNPQIVGQLGAQLGALALGG